MRPNIVETGSDLVTLPLQPENNDYLTNKPAFGPDGTGYLVIADGAVEEVSPSGQYTSVPVSRVSDLTSQIIYERGRLWMTVDRGIVSIHPDGSARHFYALAMHGDAFSAVGVADGSDADIYALTTNEDNERYVLHNSLYRINPQGVVTGIELPHFTAYGGGERVFGLYRGAAGDFYTRYDDYYGSGLQGIARIRFDGSVMLFPTGSGGGSTYQPVSPAYSGGYLYFLTSSVARVNEEDVYTWYLKRLNASGITTLRTFAPGEVASSIAVDFGGNIWVSTTTGQGAPALYDYNVSSGGYSGPFLSSASWNGPIAVGTDDNIWVPMQAPATYCCFFSGFSIFVRHVQTLEPASVTVTAMRTAAFTILETHSNGPWTAISQEPSIATVTPAISTTGTFAVGEVRSGSAQILVRDHLGNISYESVTAQ